MVPRYATPSAQPPIARQLRTKLLMFGLPMVRAKSISASPARSSKKPGQPKRRKNKAKTNQRRLPSKLSSNSCRHEEHFENHSTKSIQFKSHRTINNHYLLFKK